VEPWVTVLQWRRTQFPTPISQIPDTAFHPQVTHTGQKAIKQTEDASRKLNSQTGHEWMDDDDVDVDVDEDVDDVDEDDAITQ